LLLAAAFEVIIVARSPAVNNDGITFSKIAQKMAHSPVEAIIMPDQHPGYPAMILASRPLADVFGMRSEPERWLLAARIAAGLCGVLSVAALWLLARSVFDARIAGVCAVIFAGMPVLRQNAADAMSDAPHLLFYILAAWALVEGVKGAKSEWFIVAGIASGAAYWIRPEGLGVAVAGGAFLMLCCLWGRPLKRRQAFFAFCALAIAAGVVTWPYVELKDTITQKKDFLHLLSPQTWRSRAPGASDVAQETGAQATAAAGRASEGSGSGQVETSVGTGSLAPGPKESLLRAGDRLAGMSPLLSLVGRAVGRLIGEAVHTYYWFPVFPLLLGLFATGRQRPYGPAARFLFLLAAMNVCVLIGLYMLSGYISGRHVMPMVVVSMPWVASGVIVAAGWLTRLAARKRSPAPGTESCIAVWLLAALMVLPLLPRTLRPLHENKMILVAAARWIRENSQPGDRMLSNTPYVPWYADRPSHLVPGDAPHLRLKDATGALLHRFVVLDLDSFDLPATWREQLESDYVVRTPNLGVAGDREFLLMEAKAP